MDFPSCLIAGGDWELDPDSHNRTDSTDSTDSEQKHIFDDWLVVTGTMDFYDFPYQLGMSSSQLTKSIIFQWGSIPPTSYSKPHYVSLWQNGWD